MIRTAFLLLALASGAWVHAQFGEASTVSTGGHVQYDVAVADMDGDMDMDVIMGQDAPFRIVWVENMDGLGTFGTVHPVRPSLELLLSFAVADIDDDGDADVVVYDRSDSTVFWKANAGDGTFGPDQSVETLPNADAVGALLCTDLTGDTLPEIIYTFNGSTHWWINGGGIFSTKDSLTTMGGPPSPVLGVGDMDMDGDADFVTCNWTGFVEVGNNLDGSGTTWQSDWLSGLVFNHENHNFHLLDVEGDGDLDIVAAWHQTKWLENGAANGLPWPSFTPRLISGGFYHEAGTAGALGCGAGIDLIFSPWNANAAVEWTCHDVALGDFPPAVILPDLPRSTFLRLGDLDADGRDDLIAQHNDTLSWLRNEAPLLAEAVVLPPLDTLCALGGQYTLPAGEPGAGVWSGPSVLANVFNADTMVAGGYMLLYEATDTSGCPVAATASVEGIAAPGIVPGSFSLGCPADSVYQLAASPSGGQWQGIASADGLLDLTCAARPVMGFVSYVLIDATDATCQTSLPFFQVQPCAITGLAQHGPYCSDDTLQSIGAIGPADGIVVLSGPFETVVYVPSPPAATGWFDPAQGPGTYTVMATANGPGYCATTDSIVIVVNTVPSPSILLEPASCANEPIAFFVADTAGVFTGIVASMSADSGVAMPEQLGAGWWPYGFTATNIHGCSAVIVDSFLVNPVPSPIILTESAPCEGDTLATVVADTSGVFSGAVTGIGTTGIAQPDLLGEGAWPYAFTVTDSNGCATTIADTINVVGAPLVTIVLPPDTAIQCPTPMVLFGGAPDNGTYTINDSSQTFTVFDPLAWPLGLQVITYSYTDTVTGCTASASTNVYIDCSTLFAPLSTDPFLSLSPNPARDHIVLQFAATGTVHLRVFDATGRTVCSESNISSPHVLATVGLVEGPYSVQVCDGAQWSVTKALIIRR